ncbi:MAG: hypothetical protein HYZ17_11995 [Betaproteobacteria bacterium]|nr:hypothetical protein [Betaproteobacteria bacterium]
MTTHALAVKAIFPIFAAFATCVCLAADIDLNRINACSDIAETISSLKRPNVRCVSPTGAIEEAIRDFAAGSDVKLCFLAHPPASSLEGFRCVHSTFRGRRGIACYRSATLDLLSDYRSNFSSRYSALTSSYIEQAKRCPGSNGNASRGLDTTFPPIFMSVAEHEFGFNVQYGNTKPGSAMVSHGFARTSPAISQRGPAAIEYVVYGEGRVSELAARMPHGNWSLRVDTSPEFAAQFIRVLKRQGLDAYQAAVDIEIQRSPRALAIAKTPSVPDALSEVFVSKLEDEGFVEMDDEGLMRHTGKTREQMSNAILQGVLFGARNFLRGRMLQFRLLMKDSGIRCARGGRGAIGAYLFTLAGERGVQVDFGNFSAIVIGFGSCASSANSSREYIRNLVDESKQALLDDLQGR